MLTLFTSVPVVILENWKIIQLKAFELSEFIKYTSRRAGFTPIEFLVFPLFKVFLNETEIFQVTATGFEPNNQLVVSEHSTI